MRVPLLALAAVAVCLGQTWRMKQVADVNTGGNYIPPPVCGDVDHDSLADYAVWHSFGWPIYWTWQVLEFRDYARFDLVQAETCPGSPWPDTGIYAGAFMPTDVGDIDSDGLDEYLGLNKHYWADSIKSLLCLYESRSAGPEAYPDTLVWSFQYFEEIDCPFEWYAGDMDRDGLLDVLATNDWHTYVFEVRGNNWLDSVFRTPLAHSGYDYAIGDFDQDSATEFVFAHVGSAQAHVYECAGDDQYVLVDSFPQHFGRNGHDIVSGGDLDGDGKPEFYIIYDAYNGSWDDYYVCMHEATGDNEYACTVIDSVMGVSNVGANRISSMGDVDGDGIPELLVTFNSGVRLYKAVGNDSFQVVWHWANPSPGQLRSVATNIYDMNRNGYPDMVLSGGGHTWMYEMEGVRVLEPNGGQSLVPGETCGIRWRVFTPPRCDSVSLFLRRDSTFDLDTIATGIAPSESSYNWIVSPGPVDSCRIVAIAYGPGWLFDESDSTFAILPGGCEEASGAPVRNWALWVWPNPVTSRARVRYDVPRRTSVSVEVLDACGRVVRMLASGEIAAGHYEQRLDAGAALPAGVYVVRLSADGRRMSQKAVLLP